MERSATATRSGTGLVELAPGIHMWRATHPEWHTTTERVACYALRFDDGVLLVDPLLAGTDQASLLASLRELADGDAVHVYVTIPYHVRDAERLAQHFGPSARIHGHRGVARRLEEPSLAVDATAADVQLPFGVQAMRIGSPVRNELPLYSPTHRALAFGDAVVGVRGGIRIWQDIAGREAWFRDRLVPSFAPLAALDIDHVLVAHGIPVVGTGRAAIRGMMRAAPVATLGPELAGDATA